MEIETLEAYCEKIKDGARIGTFIRGLSLTEKEYLAMRAAINERMVNEIRMLSNATEEELNFLASWRREAKD